MFRLLGVVYASELDPFDRAERPDQPVYIVLNDFGPFGRAYCEASEDRSDLETTISDLIAGQYDNPVRVIAFNADERSIRGVLEDIARKIMRRLGCAGDELPVIASRASSSAIAVRIANSPAVSLTNPETIRSARHRDRRGKKKKPLAYPIGR